MSFEFDNSEIKKSRYQTYSEGKKSFLYNFFKRITIKARGQFFIYFKESTNYSNEKSIIDIGTTPSLDSEQNIFLTKTQENQNITCLSNQDCKILLKKFNNIKEIIVGDGKNTLLDENSFDIVHSNATLEHVGSYNNQILFVRELIRISKEYVFLQTPNRYYPIDFHTILPFIHWLPKKIHRKFLKILKLNFYSKEENLNLLSKNDLKKICKELEIIKYKIIEHKLFFLTSNLILIIEK